MEVSRKELYESFVKNKGFLDLMNSVKIKDTLVFKPKVRCEPCVYNHVCCCVDFNPQKIPVEQWHYCELFDKKAGKCSNYEKRPPLCIAWVCEEKRLLRSWCAVEASPKGINDFKFIMDQLNYYLLERKDVAFVVTKGSDSANVVKTFCQMNGREMKEIEMDYQRYKTGAGKMKNEFMSKDADFGMFFMHPRDKVIPDLKKKFDGKKKLYKVYLSNNRGDFMCNKPIKAEDVKTARDIVIKKEENKEPVKVDVRKEVS